MRDMGGRKVFKRNSSSLLRKEDIFSKMKVKINLDFVKKRKLYNSIKKVL